MIKENEINLYVMEVLEVMENMKFLKDGKEYLIIRLK
jgi:hypothetical protein